MVKVDAHNPKKIVKMDWIFILLLPSVIPVFEAAVCNKNECCPGTEKDSCINETKEECLIAKPIHNILRRITGYQPQDDEYPFCDFYISPGWYTLCGHVLSTNRTGCGTVFNWIRTGALPEDGPDLVDVCLTKKDEGECLENSQVNTSKCHDGTYVFYLVDTQSCPEAYCIESAVVTTNKDSMCTVNANEKRCEGCCVNDSECLVINGECVFNISSDVGECKCRPGSVFRDGNCSEETKEECLIAKPIHNVLRRITGYQPQDDEYPLCDFYISPGWYTLCGHVLSTNRTGCGTVFNWIRTGALPEDGPDLVDVCLTKKNEGECLENSQVNASKCHDGTYVFYLVDTQSCPEAYCIDSAVVTTNKDSMCTVNVNEERCEGCCVNDGECFAIDGECVFNGSSNVGECRCRPGSVLRDETCSEEQRCEGCCVNDGECLAIDGECVFNGSSNVGECRCRQGRVLRDETCSEENTTAKLEDRSKLKFVLAISFLLCGGIAAVTIITCLTCRNREKTASITEDKIGVYDEISHDPYTKLETAKACEKTQYYPILFVVEGSKDIYPTKGRLDEMNDDHVYTTI